MSAVGTIISVYRWSPAVLSALGFIYALAVSIFRAATYEIDTVVEVIITWTKAGIFVPISYFFVTHEKLAYREVAIALLLVVELIVIVDIYHENVAGRAYRKVDLSGQVYIITGSNTGIGFETAVALADMDATVVLACRSLDKATVAREDIIKNTKCAASKVVVLKLDLCSFDSVKAFVQSFLALGLPLHGLINNAGLMMQDRHTTPDGHEMVITANHFSHFLLTNLLLPELEKTNGRIVNLSSALHKLTNSFDFEDIMATKHYSLFGTYGQSKLANIMFTMELCDRLKVKGSKVTCNALHPGAVRTEVTRNMHPVMQFLNELFAPLLYALQKTPQQGAYCSIYVATDPSLKHVSGKYFINSTIASIGKGSKQPADRKRLWTISEEITGINLGASK